MPVCEKNPLQLRDELRPRDPDLVGKLVGLLSMFTPEELDVAVELVREGLELGSASGYRFVFLEQQELAEDLQGYACYGPVPCTRHSWDLYWIAVKRGRQHAGLGRLLLSAVEVRVRHACGRQLYAETSSLPRYAPARAFYRRCGFVERACFPAFYAPEDDKLVYEKVL